MYILKTKEGFTEYKEMQDALRQARAITDATGQDCSVYQIARTTSVRRSVDVQEAHHRRVKA